MSRLWKQGMAFAALAAVVGLWCLPPSLAAKPGGGGGGGTGGGTIYYLSRLSVYGLNSMMSDGTAKSALPPNVSGDPSRLLHGGFRWFLPLRITAGAVPSYPDGQKRWELFAVREDGDESLTVQLTDDPTLQFIGNIHYDQRVRWAPGEGANSGMIAGMAQRWVLDGSQWQVDPDSIGVYTATVLFDTDGNVDGLDAPPALLVTLPGNLGPPDFDWSPDLLEIVYATSDGRELRIVDVLTGAFRTLCVADNDGWTYSPAWSPDGSLIAFWTEWNINTIRPDGTGEKEIIRRAPGFGFYSPHWSPTASHLVCNCWYWSQGDRYDLYRFTASGGGKTNLTADIAEWVLPVAWR